MSAVGTPTFSPLAVHNHGEGFVNRIKSQEFRVKTEHRGWLAADKGVLSGCRSRYGGCVLWLGRPPYLRWFAATALIIAALVWDISERATEPFPFAATDLVRGQLITPEDVQWRPVPVGSLTLPPLEGSIAAVAIISGDPIVASLVSTAAAPPLNSWAVPVPLPIGAAPGTPVSLVFADGTDVYGTVIQPATEDSLGFTTDGLVAVEEGAANAVALAAANGELVVLIQP